MYGALETIGTFFHADSVRFWQRRQSDGEYECSHIWSKEGKKTEPEEDRAVVSNWLILGKWEQQTSLENPEAVLCDSYEMYQRMKYRGIRNQRWFRIREQGRETGCIEIDNITGSFRNKTFLETFSGLLGSELKKRSLIQGALYSDKYDDLTNLLSRSSYEEYINTYSADIPDTVGAVLANINDLKGINSMRGFQNGNYLIRQFADILKDIFGGEGIFRLNGDEFLVLLHNIGRRELEEMVTRLEERIVNEGSFSVAIGYSWDDVEKDISVLTEQATRVMTVNKKRYYDSIPNSADQERRKMLSDLISALDNREFEVFLQPKVELADNKVTGAEALIRYHHKELGLLSPSQFIDILEKNNLIRYIDLFVFEEVCRQLEKWNNQGGFVPVVSLNFSRLTLLERDILSTMESIVLRYAVSKKQIEIEITESFANMGKSVLYQAACDLYNAGFAISLDDFGTKYTSLSILADLDFSMLKLDKSLVGEIGNQLSYQLILKNIIYMCKDLGINVIAEGVETVAQEQVLRSLECQMGQGYLYGKPMPIDEFERIHLHNGAGSPSLELGGVV